jgi:phosphodiesterase/alkaline phosphatase D-like protein
MGALAYLQTPLGDTIDEILGIGGSGGDTTETVIDTTKPVISFPVQPTLGPSSVSINWTTDELSSTQVEYGSTTTYGSVQPAQPADDPTIVGGTSGGVVTHSVVITGLQPDTTYHYRVKSKDKAGNAAVSDDRTFATTEATEE